jgi:serine/threonine protein kinase
MSYCINPKCSQPSDPLNAKLLVCCHCGSSLVLQGRYQVKQLLGEGGFGKTYEVEDEQGTPKVLKVLLLNETKAVALFQQEARVLSSLNSPIIPKIEPDGYFTFFPKGRHQPLHCLVMEKIEGITLEAWRQQQPEDEPLSQEQAIAWLKCLVEILHQVHKQLYFHRNIKPSNIMLTPQGRLVLIDFGSAKEVTHTYLVKVSGERNVTRIISPGYTPIEQANGKAVLQSDFFALGRTLVYLLTGKSPNDFPEDPRTGQLLWQHRAPQVSKALTDLIDQLMAPFSGDRPHDAEMILPRISTIERNCQVPPFLPQSSVFDNSLAGLRLQALMSQHRSSSSRLKRLCSNVIKFRYPIAIASLLCSVGLATTQLDEDFVARLKKHLEIFTNQQSSLPTPASSPNFVTTAPQNPSSNTAIALFYSGALDGINIPLLLSPDGQTLTSGSGN